MIAPAQTAPDLAQIYQCLGDETRLRILNLLLERPLCVCHLQDALQLPQVKISKHLKVLRERGLIARRRYQNWNIYSLPKTPSPEVAANLHSLSDCLRRLPLFQDDRRQLHRLPIDCELDDQLQRIA